MHIIWIRLEEFMHKDVEWELFSISKKHIVTFQIRFVIHSVHDHTVPIPLLKEFFKHNVLYTKQNLRSRKSPTSCRAFVMCVLVDQNSELV